jgi:hypothetical protein
MVQWWWWNLLGDAARRDHEMMSKIFPHLHEKKYFTQIDVFYRYFLFFFSIKNIK